MRKNCKVEDCPDAVKVRGYCERHYGQIRRHGYIKFKKRVMAPRIGQKMKSGYVYILMPGHPTADKRGYVKRVRLVWEKQTGHVVIPPELIHHRNEIKTDDAFNNLKLLPNRTAHAKEHGGRIGGIRVVTKIMVLERMVYLYPKMGDPFTLRRFSKAANISTSTITNKFGWNILKEELCIILNQSLLKHQHGN